MEERKQTRNNLRKSQELNHKNFWVAGDSAVPSMWGMEACEVGQAHLGPHETGWSGQALLSCSKEEVGPNPKRLKNEDAFFKFKSLQGWGGGAGCALSTITLNDASYQTRGGGNTFLTSHWAQKCSRVLQLCSWAWGLQWPSEWGKGQGQKAGNGWSTMTIMGQKKIPQSSQRKTRVPWKGMYLKQLVNTRSQKVMKQFLKSSEGNLFLEFDINNLRGKGKERHLWRS